MNRKIITAFILGILAALMIPAVSLAATEIATKADLDALAARISDGDNCVGETFELTADIQVNGAWTPMGSSSTPFSGTFNGNGFKVTSYTVSGLAMAGFFGEIDPGGVVENTAFFGAVSANGASVTSAAGGIAAVNRGLIVNCSFGGYVSNAFNTGGLVGNNYGLVRNCFSTGTVNTSVVGGAAGGIVGEIMQPAADIQNCYSAAAVTASYKGGIVGYYTNGQIGDCYWRLSGCANAVENGPGAGFTNVYSFNDSGILATQVNGSTVLLVVLNAYAPADLSLTAWTAGTGYTYPVLHPSAYEIQATPAGHDFGIVETGYTLPEARTFTIVNTGYGVVTITQPSAVNFTVGTLSSTSLDPADTATFTLQPKPGLTAGVYDEPIIVMGSNGASVALQVNFTVIEASVYAVSINPILKNFGIAVGSYTPPAAETITITNTGNRPLIIDQPTAANYEVSALSNLVLPLPGTVTFTVQPKAGLTAGEYDETIAISGSNGVSASVQVSFTVTEAPVYGISVSPLLKNFGIVPEGYTPPGLETITLTNTGNQPVTITQPTAANYTVGALSLANLDPAGTATFTVQPKAGLASGIYTKTIAIAGTGGVSGAVQVSFTVVPPTVYPITAGANGTYHQQGPSGLTFRASGDFSHFTGITVDGNPVDESSYDAREGSTIITLHPDYLDTLTPGTHQIRINFTDGYADTSFTVAEELDPVTPPTGDNDEAAVWGMIMILCAAALALLLRRRPAHRQR